jgi:Zn-dependent protease with chaperone function
MLETLTHTISKSDFTLNRENLVRWLKPFAAATPTFYLLFVISFATLGYFALLLFPVLSIWLYLKLVSSLYSSADHQHWSDALMLGSFLLLAVLASISLSRLRFTNRAGVNISAETSPKLASLIKGLQIHYGNPRIERIVVTREDEIKIRHTPVSWFPVKFKNTLDIGLSALLCTSAQEFQGMLGREIGRLSRQKNPVTGWVLSLHRQWANYHHALQRHGDLVLKPLTFFFQYYSPIYNAVSFFAARRGEIQADRYALEIMEDDDAIKSMIQTIIFQSFLREKYWPLVMNQPKDGKHRVFLPYKKMSQTMRKSVNASDIERWVELELRKFGDTSTTLPPLKTRLHMLGHQQPVYPPALTQTAAEYYLEESIQQLLIKSFDTSWLRKAGRNRETAKASS